MQGGDRVHCFPRGRLAARGGKRRLSRWAACDGAGASGEASPNFYGLHFDSPRATIQPESN